MALKLEWGSQDMAGNFVSFAEEKRRKAAKAPGSKGPRGRGGKRNPSRPEGASAMAPAASVSRGGTRAVNATAKKPQVAARKQQAPQARAKGAGLAPIQRMKPEMTVQDVKQTIAPMDKTGLKSRKRDIKIGSIAGRTGGKWHLGKRPGKG